MATIQVYKTDGNTLLGSGTGLINTPNATINQWSNKAGLQIGKSYVLKSNKKVYSGDCNAINAQDPVAQFNNVQ